MSEVGLAQEDFSTCQPCGAQVRLHIHHGMAGIPALVINNKVKLSGRVLQKRQLKEMIAAEVKAKSGR